MVDYQSDGHFHPGFDLCDSGPSLDHFSDMLDSVDDFMSLLPSLSFPSLSVGDQPGHVQAENVARSPASRPADDVPKVDSKRATALSKKQASNRNSQKKFRAKQKVKFFATSV